MVSTLPALGDTDPVARSPLQTALLVAGIFAVGVTGGILGLPQAAVVVFTVTFGTGVLIRDQSLRREEGARRRGGPDVGEYPLTLSAERVAVGPPIQFRLLPRTRAVWAPGLLCIGPGEARFIPSRDTHADRAWAGPVTDARVTNARATASVRLSGPDGEAQFVLTAPPSNVAEAIPAWIHAPRRGGAPRQ